MKRDWRTISWVVNDQKQSLRDMASSVLLLSMLLVRRWDNVSNKIVGGGEVKASGGYLMSGALLMKNKSVLLSYFNELNLSELVLVP